MLPTEKHVKRNSTWVRVLMKCVCECELCVSFSIPFFLVSLFLFFPFFPNWKKWKCGGNSSAGAGQEALDLLDGGLNVLQQGNASEAAAAEEALRAALGRARAAEERTANAVEVLETRIADGRKTNHTVVELVREQRVINAGILHTVSSAINETRLSFLLTEHA